MNVMPKMWVLTHREAGPVHTFMSREEAESVRQAVVADEPEWEDLVRIEPFDLRVRLDAGEPG